MKASLILALLYSLTLGGVLLLTQQTDVLDTSAGTATSGRVADPENTQESGTSAQLKEPSLSVQQRYLQIRQRADDKIEKAAQVVEAENVRLRTLPADGSITWTFDDCETALGQGIVARYVQTLQAHQVKKAVFFMTGNCYYSRPDLVALITKAGYEIGNHTKDHADLSRLSANQIANEIAGGPPGTRLFRPPYGAGVKNSALLSQIRARGLTLMMWNASGGDSGTEGLKRSCDRILEDLVHTVRPGGVVLLHMFNPNSPSALEMYLEGAVHCSQP